MKPVSAIQSRPFMSSLGIFFVILMLLLIPGAKVNGAVTNPEATPIPTSQDGTDLFGVTASRVVNEPTSFLVKWKTKISVKGWIEYGTSGDHLDQTVYDIRGQNIIDDSHLIIVKNLQLSTTYFFVVVVDGKKYDNGGTPFQITLPSLDNNGQMTSISSAEAAQVDSVSTFASLNALSALQCEPEVYYGVQHCTDNNGTTHVILVNLNDSHVRVQTVLASRNNVECNSVNHKGKDSSSNCDSPYPGETLSSMLNRYQGNGAVAIINTDYFAYPLPNDHGAEGLAVRNGTRLDGISHGDTDGNATKRSSLAFSSAKVAVIGKPSSESQIDTSGAYYNTVAGGPTIVRGWQALSNSACSDDGLPLDNCTKLAQSAAGLTSDGRLVLMSAQTDAANIASYLVNFPTQSAIKFDGGGSSRVAYLDSNGIIQSRGATGEDRLVAEGLLIFSSRKTSGVCLAESPHTYPNNYDSTLTLTNPDSNATSTRIHFSRIETETGYDYVSVRDSSNNQVSRFDNSFSDVWSAAVPGRTIKVQLTSDSSITKWGFCVDRMETVSSGQAPAPPSNLQATALDSTRIQLNWNDNSNNETGFKVYDANILIATIGANLSAYTVTGLAPSSYHCYAVYAYNSYGSAGTSGWACTTTPSAGQPPAAPSNLRATALDSTRIQLNWNDNSNNETGFKVYDANILIATIGANLSAYTVTGLAPSSYHCYAVYAYNSYGSAGTSGWACATTLSATSGNLALGRPAYAYTQESATYAPPKGNDGNTSTRWSSQWSATARDEWWWTDLGTQTFDRVIVRWEAAYASQYFIGSSNDGVNYTGYWYTVSAAGAYTHNLGSRTARYAGILMRQRAPCCGNYSFFEFEVYRTVALSAAEAGNTMSDTVELAPDGDLVTITMSQSSNENTLFLPFVQR